MLKHKVGDTFIAPSFLLDTGSAVDPNGTSVTNWMEGEWILIKSFMEGKRIKSVFNCGFDLQSWLVVVINKST